MLGLVQQSEKMGGFEPNKWYFLAGEYQVRTLTSLVKGPVSKLSGIGYLSVPQPGMHIRKTQGSFSNNTDVKALTAGNKSELPGGGLGHSGCFTSSLDDSNVQPELQKKKVE